MKNSKIEIKSGGLTITDGSDGFGISVNGDTEDVEITIKDFNVICIDKLDTEKLTNLFTGKGHRVSLIRWLIKWLI